MIWKTDLGMATPFRVSLLLLNYVLFSPAHLSLLCVFYLGMLKLTYDGLFDMGMETDLRGPNSEEDKFDWFFLGKEKGGEAKTHF